MKDHRSKSPYSNFHNIYKMSVIRLMILSGVISLIALKNQIKNLFRSRARMHWIGPKRPHRPERLFIAVVYAWAIVFLEADQFITWSIVWGGLISAFVVIKSISLMVPKKKQRWVIRY